MKTLIATALIMASSASFAHDNSFSTDSCNVDLTGGINITANNITFSKNKSPLYTIANNGTLLINGEAVDLSNSQQALVSQYSSSIRQVLPEVKSIALDAIDLAIDGVNLAFNELLGDGNKVSSELTTQLTGIRNDVNNEFDSDKDFYIDEDGFEGEDFFGADFEQRIETAVESTVQNSIGSLMIAIGQEMLFSGGDTDAFERKMETFGSRIEYEMEARGERIAQRGEALCDSIIAIDNLEEQLKSTIDELADYNVVTVSKKETHNKA